MERHTRDVVGVGCAKDVEGTVVVEGEKELVACKAYYDKLSNEEFVQDKPSLTEVGRTSGHRHEISVAEVKAAIAKMTSLLVYLELKQNVETVLQIW